MTTEELLALDPVIPVVVLDDDAAAVPLARALLAGGLSTIELTLRTPAALPAIAQIAAEVPELVVGAGTVVEAAQIEAARAAGAHFLVSPGATPALLDAMSASGLPFLAGVATPSDVLALLERGIACAKLFPAAAVGGIAMAQALSGPFPHVQLCPTGGIDADARRRAAAPSTAADDADRLRSHRRPHPAQAAARPLQPRVRRRAAAALRARRQLAIPADR